MLLRIYNESVSCIVGLGGDGYIPFIFQVLVANHTTRHTKFHGDMTTPRLGCVPSLVLSHSNNLSRNLFSSGSRSSLCRVAEVHREQWCMSFNMMQNGHHTNDRRPSNNHQACIVGTQLMRTTTGTCHHSSRSRQVGPELPFSFAVLEPEKR